MSRRDKVFLVLFIFIQFKIIHLFSRRRDSPEFVGSLLPNPRQHVIVHDGNPDMMRQDTPRAVILLFQLKKLVENYAHLVTASPGGAAQLKQISLRRRCFIAK